MGGIRVGMAREAVTYYSNPLDDMVYAIDGDEDGMDELRRLADVAEGIVNVENMLSGLHERYYELADALKERFDAPVNTYFLLEQLTSGNYDPNVLLGTSVEG